MNGSREFQARVLAALEKPKAKRWIVILNSPIIIWLLSVIVLTLGGGYYTTYRQCVADAQSIASAYRTIDYEIRYRQDSIIDVVLQAKTMDDVRRGLTNKFYYSSELKDKSISELMALDRAAYLRIDRSEMNLPKSAKDTDAFHRFTLVLQQQVPRDLTDADLLDLKKYAGSVEVEFVDFIFRAAIATAYEPRCNPLTVSSIALGGSPILVKARNVGLAERERRDLRIN